MKMDIKLTQGPLAGSADLESGVGESQAAGPKTGAPGAILESGAPRAAGAPESEIGARVVFEGLVRATENDRTLAALDYEAYEPMTTRGLQKLALELGQAQMLAVTVEHSLGRVPVGQCSFRLTVCAVHRKEALAFMDAFIDRMKQEVPLWKTCVHA